MRLVEKRGEYGVVERDGITFEAGLQLVPEAEVGDYLIVHAGIAIQRLSRHERDQIETILHEIDQALGEM